MRVVAICRTSALRTEQRLLERMHELRARVFKHRLDWDVHVEHNQEKDEYDRLDPTYLVLVGNDGQVIGCARLLPSTGPTMLGQTFPFLADASRVPNSSRVVESSRFCIDTERSDIVSASGLRDATHTLFAGIIEWSMANGFDRIVTVTDVRFERILNRAKWPLERLGAPLDCTRISRQFPASRRGAFERLGTDAAEMRVAAGSVVEDLDIFEDISAGEVSGLVDAFSDALLLQA